MTSKVQKSTILMQKKVPCPPLWTLGCSCLPTSGAFFEIPDMFLDLCAKFHLYTIFGQVAMQFYLISNKIIKTKVYCLFMIIVY